MFDFVQKLEGLFDRRFVLAYWVPVAILLAGLALIVTLDRGGFAPVTAWLDALKGTTKLVVGVLAILFVTLLAYILQAVAVPMIRLYEGYTLPGWLAGWMRRGMERRFHELDTARNRAGGGLAASIAGTSFYYGFSSDDTAVRPTQLGNTFGAIEDYPLQAYGMDSVFWWPRLAAKLDKEFTDGLQDAYTPMVALLNLCTAFVGLALIGGGYLLARDDGPFAFGAVLLGGMALARGCYLAAVSQAVSYGMLVRVAFDFHRHEILTALKVPLPADDVEELRTWSLISDWLYNFSFPSEWALDDGSPPRRFAYAPPDPMAMPPE